MEITLFILFFALIADWYFGEPDILWSRFPHPVVVFGKAIKACEKWFNQQTDKDAMQYRKGAFVISGLILLSILAGFAFHWLFFLFGFFGWLLEGFVVFTLLAQRSLMDHVGAVANGLRADGIEGGRLAVSMIVGRNPDVLDQSSVCRAGIESLAENFSDGVVAPAFWYAVFGLPGLLAYKMINTADSMIGYHNERYEYFGKVAAQIDDLANWVPARISAFLIAGGTFVLKGPLAARISLTTAFRDSGLHRSPNAGWPESAMAGAAGLALGGPRIYPQEVVQQAYLNASGKRELVPTDIDEAIDIISASFFVGTGFVAVIWLFF